MKVNSRLTGLCSYNNRRIKAGSLSVADKTRLTDLIATYSSKIDAHIRHIHINRQMILRFQAGIAETKLILTGRKTCTQCHLIKPLEDYYQAPNGFHYSDCRPCHMLHVKGWIGNNMDKHLGYCRRGWRKKGGVKAQRAYQNAQYRKRVELAKGE